MQVDNQIEGAVGERHMLNVPVMQFEGPRLRAWLRRGIDTLKIVKAEFPKGVEGFSAAAARIEDISVARYGKNAKFA